jgi:hypothetical protein
MMLYPSPIMYIGATCPDNKEHLDVIHYAGAEFVKVKLKVSPSVDGDLANVSFAQWEHNPRSRIRGWRQREM